MTATAKKKAKVEKWHKSGQWDIRLRYDGKRWTAMVSGKYDNCGSTVLGEYMTEAEAIIAAGWYIALLNTTRVCTPADIDRVRKERTKQ